MRILIVTSRYPYPTWRGNQVRTAEWLEALQDHELVLMSPSNQGLRDDPRLARLGVRLRSYSTGMVQRPLAIAASQVSGHPIQEGLYATGSGRRAVERELRDWRPDLVVVQMVRCAWAGDVVQRLETETPVLFDAIDAMGLHFERAAQSVPWALRGIYRREAARCRARETALARCAALTTAVSARDLRAIATNRALVVPVAARESPAATPSERAPAVLLSGNLGYRPTVEGAEWFAREVWPEVRRQVPGAIWTLAGARPAPSVRRLSRIEGVFVHPNVPDLAPYLGAAAVAIAPMATGSGVPMKVLEAWAAGVPVVGHPWMAGGVESEARAAMVVAESAEEWRCALISLLSDREKARKRIALGREAWRRWYHPEAVARLIRRAVEIAAEQENLTPAV